jgi:hypothetical protein
LTDANCAPSRKDLRSFGLILTAGFTVIGLFPVVVGGRPPAAWPFVVALVFLLPAAIAPAVLRQPYRAWMVLGGILGWINTRVILGAVYYFMLTPLGVVMRLLGRDPLRRTLDRQADTYRVTRDARPASHFERQF